MLRFLVSLALCGGCGLLGDTGEPWVCVRYDCEAADACVRATESLTCDDFMAGSGTEVCDEVCENY